MKFLIFIVVCVYAHESKSHLSSQSSSNNNHSNDNHDNPVNASTAASISSSSETVVYSTTNNNQSLSSNSATIAPLVDINRINSNIVFLSPAFSSSIPHGINVPPDRKRLEWNRNWIELDNGDRGVTYYIPSFQVPITPKWMEVNLWNPDTLISKLLANHCENSKLYNILNGALDMRKLFIFEAALEACYNQYNTDDDKFKNLINDLIHSTGTKDNYKFLDALLYKNCKHDNLSTYIQARIHKVSDFRLLRSIFKNCGKSFPRHASQIWKNDALDTRFKRKSKVLRRAPYGYDKDLEEIIYSTRQWPHSSTISGWINIAASYASDGKARMAWGQSNRLNNFPFIHYNFHPKSITVLSNGSLGKDIELQEIIYHHHHSMKTAINVAKETLERFKSFHGTRGAVIYWKKSSRELGIVLTSDFHVAIYRDGNPIFLSENWSKNPPQESLLVSNPPSISSFNVPSPSASSFDRLSNLQTQSQSLHSIPSLNMITINDYYISELMPKDLIVITPKEMQLLTKEWDQRGISFGVDINDFPTYFLKYLASLYSKHEKQMSMMATMITD